MHANQQHPYQPARTFVNHAFERFAPRACTAEWLETICGPPLWDWDLGIIQKGFTDGLYRFFDAYPARLRPVLTALLLQAADKDPTQHEASLASLELVHLATLIVNDFRNGRTVAEATSPVLPLPLPVLATVAYTARQLSCYLPIHYLQSLSLEARTWLSYRFSRALAAQGVGTALDIDGVESETHPDDDIFYGWLKLVVAPLSFGLSVDCLVAALDAIDTPLAGTLGRAACSLGIAYRLSANLTDLAGAVHGGSATRDGAGEARISSLWASVLGKDFLAGRTPPLDDSRWRAEIQTGFASRCLRLAQRERNTAQQEIDNAPAPFAAVLNDFANRIVDPVLLRAKACVT